MTVRDIDTSSVEGQLLQTALLLMGPSISSSLRKICILSRARFNRRSMFNEQIKPLISLLKEDKEYRDVWEDKVSQIFLYSYHDFLINNNSKKPNKQEILDIAMSAARGLTKYLTI